MLKTLAEITVEATRNVISNASNIKDAAKCAQDALTEICTLTDLENQIRAKGNKLKIPSAIPNLCIAMLIAGRDDVALIAPGNKKNPGISTTMTREQKMELPIGIYQETGDNRGVWEVTNSPHYAFGAFVEMYKPDATRNDKTEIFTLLKSRLRVVTKCTIPYLVAVNNGIMDVKAKTLLPFSADLVFTSKIHTDLNMNATNPHIQIAEDGSIWDVDSWLTSLGSDSFVESIKEVIQAACVPLAPRDKMVLFYSKTGNNGKGTLCQLIRNLLGAESCVSIPLKDFSTRFGMSGLPGAVAVIVDENDVSSFNKGLGNLKAAITGDTIKIEQKYQNSYDFSFNGLILQCVNDFPNGDDKTGSFKRRLHIIEFPVCFTGQQKRYIKDELIYRKDVLEYILKTVLVDMDYREAFTETAETRTALKAYVTATNTVAAFLDEILPQCKWDLLPATDFLYEIYKEWYKKISPSGKAIGRNDFIDSVKDYVGTNLDHKSCWEWTDSCRSKGYIDSNIYEPLLLEYNVRTFTNPLHPIFKEKYGGLKRISTVATNDDEDKEGDHTV